MRALQCTIEGNLRVVVLGDDGDGLSGRLLPAAPDGRGLAAWIGQARVEGRSARELLAATAEGGEEVAVDLDAAVVRRGAEELPIELPVDAPEVWAAGVSYMRSRQAREEESGQGHSADFYRRVYDAERPEIFLKDAGGRRTVGTGDWVGVRGDSRWSVPEPEIGLVLDAGGAIVGYTIGNDMSARDIEGENPLYLPQAKIFRNCCALGPTVWLPPPGEPPAELRIALRIFSADGELTFEDRTSTAAMRRKFDELIAYLSRYNQIDDGIVLLTGTGVVPPDDFSLQDGDRVEIAVPEIGTLANPVQRLAVDAPLAQSKAV